MKLIKYRRGSEAAVGCLQPDGVVPLQLAGRPYESLADILEADDPAAVAAQLLDRTAAPQPLQQIELLPPIDQQEVWAAGVTYTRSKTARMEESEAAASCYDRVYVSPRPELFFKATPHRVAGHGQPLRIRSDSTWDVPEPELTLVLSSRLRLVGFTVGNDMSSRQIEGDNPLYLPQAKLYNQCCGLGPCIALASGVEAADQLGIMMEIERKGQIVFQGNTSVAQMARSFDDLIGWLGRENSFPNGVFLLTGTGIVPDSSFTLQPNDVIHITIDQIGTLTNPVVRG